MDPAFGIETFSWSLCWAGALGALLYDLTKWIPRLRQGDVSKHLLCELLASVIFVIVGGGTAGLCVDVVNTAWQAAAIGAGAPGIIRAMASAAPSFIANINSGRVID